MAQSKYGFGIFWYLRVEFKPECPRYTERINSSTAPPCRLVARMVDIAVMPTTKRNPNSSLTLRDKARLWAKRR